MKCEEEAKPITMKRTTKSIFVNSLFLYKVLFRLNVLFYILHCMEILTAKNVQFSCLNQRCILAFSIRSNRTQVVGVKYQVSAAKVAANLLQQGINILTGLLPFPSSSSSSIDSTFFFKHFTKWFSRNTLMPLDYPLMMEQKIIEILVTFTVKSVRIIFTFTNIFFPDSIDSRGG